MSAQGLAERHTSVDLSVQPSDYFGARPADIQNANSFGLVPEQDKDLYRVEYLYLLVFGNSNSSTEYGGIQVRASTHLYLKDGAVPVRLQRIMQRAAHRGAHLFDSSIEHPTYGGGGGEWGGGYLSGFTPTENSYDYRNWEVEPVGSSEAFGVTPGKIEWTTEVYLEVEGTNYADLSGVGQGISNPWQLSEVTTPANPPVEAQQEWWTMTYNESRESYDIHPPGRSASKQRAKKLHKKDVYINGLKVGSVTVDGRVWLKNEYANGNTYRGDYSREGLVSETSATWQSIQEGRKIAKIDESPRAVFLATARARPDDFDPVDPEDVDPDRVVQEGGLGGTMLVLSLPQPDEPTLQECRQDRQLIKHLGYSNPPYSHRYAEMWKWPGFRPIEEYGAIMRRDELERDLADDQSGLDEFEEGGR